MFDRLGRVTCRECGNGMRMTAAIPTVDDKMLIRFSCDGCWQYVEYAALMSNKVSGMALMDKVSGVDMTGKSA